MWAWVNRHSSMLLVLVFLQTSSAQSLLMPIKTKADTELFEKFDANVDRFLHDAEAMARLAGEDGTTMMATLKVEPGQSADSLDVKAVCDDGSPCDWRVVMDDVVEKRAVEWIKRARQAYDRSVDRDQMSGFLIASPDAIQSRIESAILEGTIRSFINSEVPPCEFLAYGRGVRRQGKSASDPGDFVIKRLVVIAKPCPITAPGIRKTLALPGVMINAKGQCSTTVVMTQPIGGEEFLADFDERVFNVQPSQMTLVAALGFGTPQQIRDVNRARYQNVIDLGRARSGPLPSVDEMKRLFGLDRRKAGSASSATKKLWECYSDLLGGCDDPLHTLYTIARMRTTLHAIDSQLLGKIQRQVIGPRMLIAVDLRGVYAVDGNVAENLANQLIDQYQFYEDETEKLDQKWATRMTEVQTFFANPTPILPHPGYPVEPRHPYPAPRQPTMVDAASLVERDFSRKLTANNATGEIILGQVKALIYAVASGDERLIRACGQQEYRDDIEETLKVYYRDLISQWRRKVKEHERKVASKRNDPKMIAYRTAMSDWNAMKQRIDDRHTKLTELYQVDWATTQRVAATEFSGLTELQKDISRKARNVRQMFDRHAGRGFSETKQGDSVVLMPDLFQALGL